MCVIFGDPFKVNNYHIKHLTISCTFVQKNKVQYEMSLELSWLKAARLESRGEMNCVLTNIMDNSYKLKHLAIWHAAAATTHSEGTLRVKTALALQIYSSLSKNWTAEHSQHLCSISQDDVPFNLTSREVLTNTKGLSLLKLKTIKQVWGSTQQRKVQSGKYFRSPPFEQNFTLKETDAEHLEAEFQNHATTHLKTQVKGTHLPAWFVWHSNKI